jgi:phospholipase D1/2
MALDQLAPTRASRPSLRVRARELLRNPLVIVTLASLAMALVLTLLWTVTPLRDQLTPENASDWITSVASRWWTPLLLLALFVLSGIIVFPRPLLTIAAVVAWGPWKGFALSMVGVELATFAGYYVGYLCPRGKVEQWAGPTLARMAPLLHRNGLATMTLLRLLPIGPHVLGSVAAGALRIKPWHVLAGTFIGMAPGLIGTTLVADQLAAGITSGRHMNQWILWGSVLGVAILLVLSKVWYQRLAAQSASPSSR